MYEWLMFGHLVGVSLLVAGFSIYVATVARLPRLRTLSEARVLLGLVIIGERILMVGGAVLIPFALIMATQYWSLYDGWIATSIVLVLLQGAAGAFVNSRVRSLHTKLARIDASSGAIPREITAHTRSRLIQAIDRAAIANLIEIIFLMTVKPVGFPILLSLLTALLAAAILASSALWARG
ncbi:MAG: DUF2269 family protein [Actinobacteria bacterium]|nr:DUF2269 family protein [Actinomycetota bacterium]